MTTRFLKTTIAVTFECTCYEIDRSILGHFNNKVKLMPATSYLQFRHADADFDCTVHDLRKDWFFRNTNGLH